MLFNAGRILHERNTSPSRRSHHDKACTWNVSLNKALFAIRGLARAFLRPRESIMPWVTRAGQRSAYYCQTLGKPLLDSTQTFPRKAKDASCSTDDEGLFAGISMRSSPKAWLTFRAAFTLRVTRTSRCLALDSHFALPRAWLALRIASRLPSFDWKTLKNYACFVGISWIKWSLSSGINHCWARRWNFLTNHCLSSTVSQY